MCEQGASEEQELKRQPCDCDKWMLMRHIQLILVVY